MQQVLEEIGADEVPILNVMNKIDATDSLEPTVELNDQGQPEHVYVSAKASLGLDILLQSIAELVASDRVKVTLKLPPKEGRVRGLLFDLHAVTEELVDESGNFSLTIDISLSDWRRIQQRVESDIEQYVVS